MKRWKLAIAAIAALAVLAASWPLLVLPGSERTSSSGCVRRQYANADDYVSKMREQGLLCKVVEETDGTEGVPEGCDNSGITKTLLISCTLLSGDEQEGKAAYWTISGIVDFTTPGKNPGEMHIPVNEHCRYLILSDPGEYAGKQQKAGFECSRTNESSDIYGITPVCREFMSAEAQRDAGLQLAKTIYFNCTLSGNMTNVFPVYQAANGSFVFFGELK